MDGDVDEVRISQSPLSADWIAAEYANQNAPATFYAVGSGTAPPREYYVPITIDHTLIASDLTSFPVYVDLANLPAGFWSTVQTDGGDIAVTTDDGTTRLPVELVAIDTGASTGELHFLADSILAATDTTFRIYFGAALTITQPAAGDTYGRNAVWAALLCRRPPGRDRPQRGRPNGQRREPDRHLPQHGGGG